MTVKPHITARRLQVAAQRPRQSGDTRAVGRAPLYLAVAVAALVVSMQTSPVRGQDDPTDTKVVCPGPQPLVRPPELPEFVSSGGILEGTINLCEEDRRLPTSMEGVVTCADQVVRVFKKGECLPPAPPAQKPTNVPDPIPGPTLRARVGDLIQLKFVNQIDANRFDPNLIDGCMVAGKEGNVYPGAFDKLFDKHPNCLHASSTANIHFHGTHTNPNSTGDNVYLQIRPLPRDNPGNLTTTPAKAMVSFEEFFTTCRGKLKNPLEEWPTRWSDLPKPYTDKQSELLKAYQEESGEPIWDRNNEALNRGDWPIYYIGAYPYCFALPAYTAETWPPPLGSTSPVMGQAPGTHWYHAHKHGSTAINVASGMTGAFIIEGKYDDDLDAAYAGYTLKDNKPWKARLQPVLVLNQLGTIPNLLRGGGTPGNAGVDFVVNGRLHPIVEMQPGEIQLWRIVNTSGRSAAYFMAPKGLKWRQLAQDGVQFADFNYVDSENKPFYMAPANRVDLLVRAPMNAMNADVRIQNVMARRLVGATQTGTVLLTVKVSGPAVKRGNQNAQMPFLNAPDQPKFLADITDQEWKKSGSRTKELVFNSKGPRSLVQHTINNIQFKDKGAHVNVDLGTVEEWTVKNTTNLAIDHPLHIHINPFQITEFFDPNEKLVDPTGKVTAVPKYVTDNAKVGPGQCFLDRGDPSTWRPRQPCAPAPRPNLIWWDVFAIPSSRLEKGVVIPGYFKMRSRFVDYPGLYVMHCHILIHEDRGMMFSVEVKKPGAPAKPMPDH